MKKALDEYTKFVPPDKLIQELEWLLLDPMECRDDLVLFYGPQRTDQVLREYLERKQQTEQRVARARGIA